MSVGEREGAGARRTLEHTPPPVPRMGEPAGASEAWAFCADGRKSLERRRFARDHPCATTEKPGGLLRAGERDQKTRQHATRPVFGWGPGGAHAGGPPTRGRRRLRSLGRAT